jgi:hypothetical protein
VVDGVVGHEDGGEFLRELLAILLEILI